MARLIRTYILIIFILVVFMFIMLYHDSQQQQLYLGEDNNTPAQLPIEFDKNDEYRDAHGHDKHHEHKAVAHDIQDDDDSHEFAHPQPLIQDKPWGEKYATPRLICLVPTLWPKKKFVMEAIARTWGARCDKLFFVIDDEVPAPDTLYNATILRLTFDHKQSTKDRNIWEKVWKMWYHIGSHHLNDGDFFFKIDDDSFFSAVNFRGFGQYYNPDREWYFGHTLMHSWHYKNIAFNSGTCYGISRGSLRKVFPVFETEQFLNDPQRSQSYNYCVHRSGDQEDPTFAICLHSFGISATNTLDNQFRERFLTFRPGDHAKIPRERTWFWKHKHPKVGAQDMCCSPNPISFHNFKKDAYLQFDAMDKKYNIAEGVNGKVFQVPMNNNNGTFLFNKDTVPPHDEWFNLVDSPVRGQRIYKGVGNERFCYKCDRYNIK